MTTECLSNFDIAAQPKVRVPARRTVLARDELIAIVLTGAGFILLLPAATVLMAVLK
jgi:hypothetical protein